MVVERKSNGKLRFCIDPRPLNKALKRQHYPLPVIDDILPTLRNAKVFSVLDAKNEFWQLALDADSSKLTTMATPFGRLGGDVFRSEYRQHLKLSSKNWTSSLVGWRGSG